MELLVYVRNHGGKRTGNTYVGASLGLAPTLERLEMHEPLTSSAEFRVDAVVDDPTAELRSIVEQIFAMGAPEAGRPVYLSRRQSALRILVEPGFDTPFDVLAELTEMIAMCAPKLRAAQCGERAAEGVLRVRGSEPILGYQG